MLGVFVVIVGFSGVYSSNEDNCEFTINMNPYFCFIESEFLDEINSVIQEDNIFDIDEKSEINDDSQNDTLLSLPECSIETKLFIPPLNLEDYSAISTLGNINPPIHTIPSDHIGMYITKVNDLDMVVANIYAPGDIRIIRIGFTKYFINNTLFTTDYRIAFSPCKDQTLEFGHVNTINTELQDILNNTELSCSERYGIEPETTQQCMVSLSLDVEAGIILGTAGGVFTGTHGIDFAAWDFGAPPLQYASSIRYGPSTTEQYYYAVCALNLFTDEAREEMESKIQDYRGNKRTIEPICGEVMQDIPGTAQGNWFAGEDLTDWTQWDGNLAFVHDNFNPLLSVISVGGTIMDSGFWHFTAENNGSVNRKFSDITPDGKKYCYDSTANYEYQFFQGFLIIQLLNTTEMLVEHGNGTCESNIDFVNPTIYHR